MFIKTVSTTSGINPIKFDETGGVFYWILNTGLSTIYASTKSTFTAGDDGVVSLGPKESRRLETNNDTIYILGAGQVEIHNQRDGICSFKQAPTSSGSGGGGTIDAYSKTESDAKYAQKTDIPSSLPANGGNADTVDGYHVDNLIHVSESFPPEYITEFLRINNDTKSIERWSANNLKVAFANNAAKAENADTVDGLHANDFTKIIDFGFTETDTKTAIGQPGKTTIYRCSKWTDYPSECYDGQGTVIAINYSGDGTAGVNTMWVKQIFLTAHAGGSLFHIRCVDNTDVGKWEEISTTPIKSTGRITSPTDQYGTIILPNSSTRRYLSITAVGCYAELFLVNDEYTVHIVDGNYKKVINTPITYIAFYIE